MCSPKDPPRLPPASPSACRNFYVRTSQCEISQLEFFFYSYVKIIFDHITRGRKSVRFKYISQNPGQSNVEFTKHFREFPSNSHRVTVKIIAPRKEGWVGGSQRQSQNIYSSLHHFAQVVKCLTDGVTHGTELSASRPRTEPASH